MRDVAGHELPSIQNTTRRFQRFGPAARVLTTLSLGRAREGLGPRASPKDVQITLTGLTGETEYDWIYCYAEDGARAGSAKEALLGLVC